MSEFDFISKYFAPLAGEGAFGLRDDAAILSGGVVTKDLLVEGVHFRPEDPLNLVAQKALRTNISDLVAKGCQPRDYLLGLTWPADIAEASVAKFAAGLAADQNRFGLSLLGGDTTRGLPGAPLVISITMIGVPFGNGPVLRSGAGAGDILMVTGCIGDGGLGLKTLLGEIDGGASVIEAYQRPSPPFALAKSTAQFASAALDVSDGLVADLSHLLNASGVGATLIADSVPLSAAGKAFASDAEKLGYLLTCGDDYQVLCAIPPANIDAITASADNAKIRLTQIGVLEASLGLRMVRQDGAAFSVAQPGYQHF